MQRNTSVVLGEHFSSFVSGKIAEGRFESASEAIRAGLRLLETEEARLEALKGVIQKGIDSGLSERSPEDVRKGIKKRLSKRDRPGHTHRALE